MRLLTMIWPLGAKTCSRSRCSASGFRESPFSKNNPSRSLASFGTAGVGHSVFESAMLLYPPGSKPVLSYEGLLDLYVWLFRAQATGIDALFEWAWSATYSLKESRAKQHVNDSQSHGLLYEQCCRWTPNRSRCQARNITTRIGTSISRDGRQVKSVSEKLRRQNVHSRSRMFWYFGITTKNVDSHRLRSRYLQ